MAGAALMSIAPVVPSGHGDSSSDGFQRLSHLIEAYSPNRQRQQLRRRFACDDHSGCHIPRIVGERQHPDPEYCIGEFVCNRESQYVFCCGVFPGCIVTYRIYASR